MEKNRFVATIIGKQGSGKSHLVEHQVLPLLIEEKDKPIFILDTMNEYGSKEDGSSYGVVYYSILELKKDLVKNNMNLTGVYILKADTDRDCEEFFELFTRVKKPCSIIVEEASKFCNPYGIDENLYNILNYGRHWSQDIIFMARRPAELNRNVTAQSDFIISFIQTESRDINALSKVYDDAEKLPDLNEEKYEYLVFGNLPDHLKDLEKRSKKY